MTGALGTYLLSVAAVGLLVSLILSLLPEGPLRRSGTFVGSLLLILAVLSPLVKLDADTIAQAIARVRMEAREAVSGVETDNREILAAIIKEDCETYIWDKARDMGLVLEEVVVAVEEGVGYPYPTGVAITAGLAPAQQLALMEWIEETLGIPQEKQEWIAM